jgi:mannosylglycerate synthase
VSLVVFPFKDEDTSVVGSNLSVAAGHERVHEVWAVAAAEGAVTDAVARLGPEVGVAHGIPVRVFTQERLGSFRPGKGDGMNTALVASAERGFDRTHFYDADITNFDASWIDGAEAAADRGFGVVRHRFPRAATDAMITWMVTRPGLAMSFPGTLLPRLGQPLGGEILLVGDAVQRLANDPFVRERSDWGIDTVITYATSTMGLGIYEHNAPDGKRHALYESLTDIRDMVLECLDAVISLRGKATPVAATTVFESDPPAPVPADLKETVAYDVAATRASIATPPTGAELDLLLDLGVVPGGAIDEVVWGQMLARMLERFELRDPTWREVAFRLWVERVISYTTTHVPRGYDHAIEYLEGTIARYEQESRLLPSSSESHRDEGDEAQGQTSHLAGAKMLGVDESSHDHGDGGVERGGNGDGGEGAGP